MEVFKMITGRHLRLLKLVEISFECKNVIELNKKKYLRFNSLPQL